MTGGITTFAALSYIVFVQPGLLSQLGMDFQAVLVATCLAAAFSTFLLGLLANSPVALAPGMGENFFFVYALCALPPIGFGLSWQQALTATLLAGLLFMALSLTGFLGLLVNVIPDSLKNGIAAGIGLFIALIGFEYGNLVRLHPVTILQLGDLRHPVTLLALAGLGLTIALLVCRVPGAILLGILGATCLALFLGMAEYRGIFSADLDISGTFLQLDFSGLFSVSPSTLAAAIFVLFLLDLFDSVGTVVGVRQASRTGEGWQIPAGWPGAFFQRNRYRRGSMPGNLHGGLLRRVCGRSFRRCPDGVGQHGDGCPAACGDVFQPAGFPRGRRYRDWTGRRR